MRETTLVLGATGNVGRPLVRALQAQGLAVRAASRGGADVEGAPGVVFDYTRPETHAAAFEGVAQAYVMLPAGYVQAAQLLIPILHALAQRQAKIVLQSVLGVDADDALPYRQAEIALQRSGARHVILRPNWFADNFHTFWKHDIAQGRIALPAGQGLTSFIDARDIAASAAAALAYTRFEGRAFDLTGPEALGYAQAADVLSTVVGRRIEYTAIDDAEFIQRMTAADVPADYAGLLAAIFHPVREGWTASTTDAVALLTGQAPRSLLTYAQDHAHQMAA